MMLYTTLNAIKKKSPCESGWKKLLTFLGKTKSDNEMLSFQTIIESNGFDDALWCLRAPKDNDREIILFAVWCARQVEYLDKSGVSKRTNDVSERFANKNASKDDLYYVRDAAWYAARHTTSCAARHTTSCAAWIALSKAAWAASSNSPQCAAWITLSPGAWPDSMADSMASAMAAQEAEFIKRFCTED